VVLDWTEGPTLNPSELALDPLFRTEGWSGAAGFLRCAVTKSADATVAPIVRIVAAAFSRTGLTSDRDRRLEE
jgi:hypothetical protein